MAITSANNISGYKHMIITSVIKKHKQVALPPVNNKLNIKNNYIWQLYCKDNIPHTPSKVGVLESTFSHTPEEAMSVGLVKACVL